MGEKTPAGALDHRLFWDAMDHLDTEALRRIETEPGRRMVTEFGLDLCGLVLDMTNFATYIDSANDRTPIAQTLEPPTSTVAFMLRCLHPATAERGDRHERRVQHFART